MRLDRIIIAFILVAFILLGGITIMQTMYNPNRYNIDYSNSSLNNLTSVISGVEGNASAMKGDTTAGAISSDFAEDNIVKKAYNGVTKVWAFTTLPGRMLAAVAIDIGLPKIFIDIINLIIVIIIIFALFYLAFRFQNR